MSGFSAPPQRRSDWAWFAGICLFALLLRVPAATIPLERDEGGYAYTAQRWLQGDLPYRDSFDKKPPGVFVVYALIERFIGTSPAAIHWGTQLYTLGTLAVIFVLGRRLSSPTAGLAAAAFAAFMTTDPSVLGNAANAEIFMILPLTAAMLAACYAVESESVAWVFVSGLCAGAGLIFKQVAITDVLFYALFITWGLRRQLLAVPVLLLGLAALPALTGAYFALHGAAAELVDATLTHSFAYAMAPVANAPQSLWRTLPHVLSSFWPFVLLASAQVVAGCFGVALGPGVAAAPVRRSTLLVLMWLLASCAGVLSGGYFRLHYYVQLIPPLAVLAGMAVERLPRARLPRLIVPGVVVVAIVLGGLPNLWYYSPGDADAKSVRLYGNTVFAASPAAGEFIAAHSTAQDSVFVLGSEPQILYYADRRSATRYIFVHPLTGDFADAHRRQLELLDEVHRQDPRFIVTVFLPSSISPAATAPTDIFDNTRDVINQSYHLAAVLGLTMEGTLAPLVSGQPAEAMWEASPVWYGGFWWCALAVWERVAPAPGANRAAAEAESRRGVERAEQGDLNGAVAHYREAVRLDPRFSAAYNNLATAFTKLGQTNEAIEQYKEAMRLSPLRPEPHWNVAGVLQDAGRLPEAIEQFRGATQLDLGKVEVRFRLATLYAQTGQLREAADEFNEVLHQRPDASAAEASLAWLLATATDGQLRNGTRAVQLAEDAAQRTQRRNPNVLNSLAAAYAEVGRYADAASVATQAIEAARSSGQPALQDALAKRLSQYRDGRPVRDGPGAPPL